MSIEIPSGIPEDVYEELRTWGKEIASDNEMDEEIIFNFINKNITDLVEGLGIVVTDDDSVEDGVEPDEFIDMVKDDVIVSVKQEAKMPKRLFEILVMGMYPANVTSKGSHYRDIFALVKDPESDSDAPIKGMIRAYDEKLIKLKNVEVLETYSCLLAYYEDEEGKPEMRFTIQESTEFKPCEITGIPNDMKKKQKNVTAQYPVIDLNKIDKNRSKMTPAPDGKRSFVNPTDLKCIKGTVVNYSEGVDQNTGREWAVYTVTDRSISEQENDTYTIWCPPDLAKKFDCGKKSQVYFFGTNVFLPNKNIFQMTACLIIPTVKRFSMDALKESIKSQRYQETVGESEEIKSFKFSE
jgi:hypothetical protein